jgi:hypothetical protein
LAFLNSDICVSRNVELPVQRRRPVSATKHSGNTNVRLRVERAAGTARLMGRTQQLRIIHGGRHATQASHDHLRRRPGAASNAGDWHDVGGHHRYYGSSAANDGERLVESRRGKRPRPVNPCGV